MAEPQRTPTLWDWIRQGWHYFKLGINPPPIPPVPVRYCADCGEPVGTFRCCRGTPWP